MKRVLSILVLLGLLAGCTANGGGDGQSANVPMGRYVEEDGPALEGVSRLLGFREGSAGGAVFYVSEEKDGTVKTLRYILSGADLSLSAQEPEWLKGKNTGGSILMDVSEGKDGLVYALVSGDGGERLFRTVDGVKAEEVPLPKQKAEAQTDGVGSGASAAGSFSATVDMEGESGAPEGAVSGGVFKAEEGRLSEMPTRYAVGVSATDDGGFLLIYMDGTAVHCSDEGTEIVQIPGQAGKVGRVLFGTEFLVRGTQGKELLTYDIEKAEQTGAYPYDNLDYSTLAGMDETGLFLADTTGIYRQAKGGSLWERLVDGDLTSLTMPDCSLEALCADGDGGFLGVLRDGERYRLVRYRYSADLPTNPDTELTIFGLADSATVRQTIGEFQRRNPNVRVNFRVAQASDSAATTEDLIRALNTELLGGKAPDLLLLDGLPVDSYIDKGVLLDITDLLGEWQSSLGLLPNLLSAYDRDGRRYGVPSRFGVPVMVGEGAAVDETRSILDLLNQVEARQKETPPFLHAPGTLWDEAGILMKYYDARANDWSGEDRTLDRDALAQYLSGMLSLNGVLRENTPERGSEAAVTMAFASSSKAGFEIIDMGAAALEDGRARFHIQNLSGFLNLDFLAKAVSGNEGYKLAPLFGGDTYLPTGGIGITAAGKQQELATNFLELMLSQTVQDKNLSDGFPVNGNSLDKLAAEQLEGVDDAGFTGLCRTLNTPVMVDQVVKAAVERELKGLMDGETTPEQAAENVEKSTALYRAE